jgi:hypothetical protein
MLYSIHYRNEGTSSSVSDVDHYVIIRKLTDSIFNVPPVFVRQPDLHTQLQRTFL